MAYFYRSESLSIIFDAEVRAKQMSVSEIIPKLCFNVI